MSRPFDQMRKPHDEKKIILQYKKMIFQYNFINALDSVVNINHIN